MTDGFVTYGGEFRRPVSFDATVAVAVNEFHLKLRQINCSQGTVNPRFLSSLKFDLPSDDGNLRAELMHN